jgi:hypothetical protein
MRKYNYCQIYSYSKKRPFYVLQNRQLIEFYSTKQRPKRFISAKFILRNLKFDTFKNIITFNKTISYVMRSNRDNKKL